MSASLHNARGGCGLAVRRKAPRLVVAAGAFAARVAAHFREIGWDVCTAPTTDDAIWLTLRKNPTALLLPADAGTESGFLVCAKLRQTRPKLKVVLVGPEADEKAKRFAGFVGAAFAPEAMPAEELARLV